MKAESGEIDLRLRVGIDTEVAGIRHDADDGNFTGSGTHDADEDVGADWISSER